MMMLAIIIAVGIAIFGGLLILFAIQGDYGD